ncbi:hypothetical protein [Streptomyces purpurascens]|uniref:hypothetical protein n=1 Tax=Streptomyces purpurascens TaxID=1924 RepID=UPI001674BE6D|nr:hypothetical protein [Streptomyces purpurascens]MCE7049677.1 hypothetical protein [Streptomyces purpurascens]
MKSTPRSSGPSAQVPQQAGSSGSTSSASRSTSALASEPPEWNTWIEKSLLPALAVASALLFGLLTVEYDQFYRELGMAPGDVGIEYSTQLSGSAGLAALSIVTSAALFAAVAIGLAMAHRWGWAGLRDRANRARAFLWGRERRALTMLVCCATGILLVGALVSYVADEMADNVKGGKWVEPLHIGPVTLLSVRAYPAEVRLTVDDGSKRLALTSVDSNRLLYIGRGPNTVVLYDYKNQRPLYLPAKDVTITTYNCETWRAAHHDQCRP